MSKQQRQVPESGTVDWKRYASDAAYRQGVDDGRADATTTAQDDLKSISNIRSQREQYRRERDMERQRSDSLQIERDQAQDVIKNVMPPGIDAVQPGGTRVGLTLFINIGKKDGSPHVLPILVEANYPGDPLHAFTEIVPQMSYALGYGTSDMRGDVTSLGFTTETQYNLLFQLLDHLPGETDQEYDARRKSVLNTLWENVNTPEYSRTRAEFTDLIGKFIGRTKLQRKKRIEASKETISRDLLDTVSRQILSLPDGKIDRKVE